MLYMLPLRLNLFLVATIVGLIVGIPAFAQNLLMGSDFDDPADVVLWPDPSPTPGTTITWEPPPMDVDGSMSSGSMRVETEVEGGAADGPMQCIVSGPDLSYRGRAWVYVPTQSPEPFPWVSINYYDNADCSGAPIDFDGFFMGPQLDEWKKAEFEFTTVPDTMRVGFRVLSANPFSLAPTEVFYDALFLPEPSGGAAALVALFALRTLRRRS